VLGSGLVSEAVVCQVPVPRLAHHIAAQLHRSSSTHTESTQSTQCSRGGGAAQLPDRAPAAGPDFTRRHLPDHRPQQSRLTTIVLTALEEEQQ
jgi:hypothetical protein